MEGVRQFPHDTRLTEGLPPSQGLDAPFTIKHLLSPKMEKLLLVPVLFPVTQRVVTLCP